MSEQRIDTTHISDLEYNITLLEQRMDIIMAQHSVIKNYAQDISCYKSIPEDLVEEWETLSRLYRYTKREIAKSTQTNRIYREKDANVERHESYGSIILSNPSGQVNLFGSGIKHQHFISLTIARASVRRELHRDWIHPEEELIRIDMSHEQWGRFISGVGRGSGTPCTISNIEQQQMDPPPFVNKQLQYTNELKDKISGLVEKMERISEEICPPLMASGTISKKDRVAVAKSVESLIQTVRSNLPFLVTSYNETLESMVGAALTEVESYINHTARLAGEDAARNISQLQTTLVESIDATEPENEYF